MPSVSASTLKKDEAVEFQLENYQLVSLARLIEEVPSLPLGTIFLVPFRKLDPILISKRSLKCKLGCLNSASMKYSSDQPFFGPDCNVGSSSVHAV